MARVKVSQADGEIVVYDGAESHVYKVKDGEIDVADDHLAAVLAAAPDSEMAKPAKGVD